MSAITAEQALSLASEFQSIAAKAMAHRFSNWESLTDAQRGKLELQESRLLNSANSLITCAVDTVLDDAGASMKSIRRATREAKKVVKKVAQTKAVIAVITNAAKLASSILAQDLSGIAKSAKATYDSSVAAAAA